MKIEEKKESIELLKKGLFGNRLRIWDSIDEILEDGYNGTVSIRYKGGGRGRFCAYEVPIHKIPEIQEEWIKNGAKKEWIIFNESAPDNLLLIQGELMIYNGYCLFYSTERKKMNEALKNGKHAKGLSAKLILEHFLDPSSYNDILALFENFPDHVVEFGTYSICLGDIPGRNTIIWDVRYY